MNKTEQKSETQAINDEFKDAWQSSYENAIANFSGLLGEDDWDYQFLSKANKKRLHKLFRILQKSY